MIGRVERLLKPGRVPCAVPGCHCTTKAMGKDGRTIDEWVCRKHWQGVKPMVKRRHKLRQEQVRAAVDGLDGSDMTREEYETYRRFADLIWSEAKRQAIESAMGI